MLAALERWLASPSDEPLLELLTLLDTPELLGRKLQAKLEALLTRAAWRAAVDAGRVSPELLRMALEYWRESGEYGPQTACDIAGRLLMHDPADEYAVGLYIQASVADAYAHRGTSLEDIAGRTSDPRVRGRLLLAHAFIDHVVFDRPPRAAAGVHRALAADPSLAYEAIREQVLLAMGLAEAGVNERDQALPPRDAW